MVLHKASEGRQCFAYMRKYDCRGGFACNGLNPLGTIKHPLETKREDLAQNQHLPCRAMFNPGLRTVGLRAL